MTIFFFFLGKLEENLKSESLWEKLQTRNCVPATPSQRRAPLSSRRPLVPPSVPPSGLGAGLTPVHGADR